METPVKTPQKRQFFNTTRKAGDIPKAQRDTQRNPPRADLTDGRFDVLPWGDATPESVYVESLIETRRQTMQTPKGKNVEYDDVITKAGKLFLTLTRTVHQRHRDVPEPQTEALQMPFYSHQTAFVKHGPFSRKEVVYALMTGRGVNKSYKCTPCDPEFIDAELRKTGINELAGTAVLGKPGSPSDFDPMVNPNVTGVAPTRPIAGAPSNPMRVG